MSIFLLAPVEVSQSVAAYMRHASDLRSVSNASASSQAVPYNLSRPHAQKNPELERQNNNERDPHPRNAHGIRLRPTTDLRMCHIIRYLFLTILIMSWRIHPHDTSPPADMYRSLFKFGVFNAVQSKSYDSVCLRLESVCFAFNQFNRSCRRTTIRRVFFWYADILRETC